MERNQQSEQVETPEPEAREGATPRGGGNGGWTAALALAGLLSICASAATIFSDGLSSDASWIALELQRAGISSGDFFVAGAVAIGLAAVSAALSGVGKRVARIESAVSSVEKMEIGMASLRTRVSRVHLEITVLQEANKTLLKTAHNKAQDDSAVQTAGMQIDAIYRLAASMDQLGARLEGQLQDQNQSIHGQLGDLTSSMFAARERLDKLIAERDEVARKEAAATAHELQHPAARLPEEPEEVDLDVLVSLDDSDDFSSFDLYDSEAADEPRVDPAQFDWGAPPDPVDAHEPQPEPQQEEQQPATGEGGLGLLDALDDQGAPIGDIDAVPSLIPGLQSEQPAPAASDPDPTDGQDPQHHMLSEEILHEALENAKRRPVE